ncbi:MAG: HlyD family secretion protein [Alphaproteobacteria bacterium]|nr:HlyD family secretion protein [Alphaproteobacteria bacterium]
MKKYLTKPIILPVIFIAALLIVVIAVKSKPAIDYDKLQFPTKTVEIITAKKIPFRARAIGYGNVEPAVLMKARSEISGKISYIHPDLKKGASLAKGTVVLRIEPTTFEFSLNQSKATLASSKSSLKQLEVEEASTKRSLGIARENLKIGQAEMDRFTTLWEKRVISRSARDAQEQKLLQLRQQVEELEGKLATYASRRAATQAQVRKSKTQLDISKDTLGRTEITLPFDARIGSVYVEKGEFVATNTALFEALGTKAVEINAQLPVSQFAPLIAGLTTGSVNLQRPEDLKNAFAHMQIGANVSLVGEMQNMAKWHGELLRIGEAVDPTRDTIGLVVVVNNPYQDIIPGKRPPLLKGMYMAVEFYAPPRKMMVLPRKAIHQGRVYVATADNKLDIRPVEVLLQQGDLVVIGKGISEGEKIIITDVIPVIDGLPLAPIEAKPYEMKLAKDALGDMGERGQ